jgi:predicted GNAT family acetyltransferase
MLSLVRHSEPSSFSQATFAYLHQDEVIHNVLIGVTSRFAALGRHMDYQVHVENAQGEVVAAAMKTAENTGAVISNIADEAALPLLVEDFAKVFETLPTVLGRPEEASRFAELWKQAKGQGYHTKMEEGIYRLDTLIPPSNVQGECRLAEKDDFDLLVRWILAFDKDARLNEINADRAAEMAESKSTGEELTRMRLWLYEGKPVSMAAAGRKTANGMSVGPVYTPQEFRGKGYGSAVTAAVSQAILNSGKQCCFLYTDMSNPTSNKIYQAIGYRYLNAHRVIAFE